MLSVGRHGTRGWIGMHGMACLLLQAQCSWPHPIMGASAVMVCYEQQQPRRIIVC